MKLEQAIKLCAPFVMAACSYLRAAGLSQQEVRRLLVDIANVEFGREAVPR